MGVQSKMKMVTGIRLFLVASKFITPIAFAYLKAGEGCVEIPTINTYLQSPDYYSGFLGIQWFLP